MDKIVSTFSRVIIKPEGEPLLETLRKQNEEFQPSENTKLLMEGDDSQDFDEDACDSDDEDFEGASGKEISRNLLQKILKLYQYTSLSDKFILVCGIIFTVIHAASFPILAILFGKISNAYILHTLHEMQNTTLHPHHNASNPNVGVTGKLALKFLTKVTSKVNPSMNASVIPTKEEVSGSGYFGEFSFYQSNGTETIDDFATYVADFSLYYMYIGIAVFVASFLQILSWEWIAEVQLYRIRQKYIYQLQRQEMTWFGRRAAGDLVLKMADHCERFREGVGEKFVRIIEYITIALYGAGIGFLTNAKLTFVFLASAPFILTKLAILWQKEFAKAGKISSEALNSMKTIASLAREKKEVERYKAALNKGTTAAEKRELFSGFGTGGMYFTIFAFYAVALWYSVNLLAEGAITPGEIYTVFFSLTICAFAIGSVLPYLDVISSAFASFKLLGVVLDSVPNIDCYSSRGYRLRIFGGSIKFDNVTFAYPGKETCPIFKDFQLNIPQGSTAAIVGNESSGKGSLVNLMFRFYDPQVGSIKFDKHCIRTLNLRWVREQIAVVNQSLTHPETTILENIRSFRKDITEERVIEVAKLTQADKFIKKLRGGYKALVKRSGGVDLAISQLIQVYIAKYIISNPKILILDKVLSTLDADKANAIVKNLVECRKNDTTIILDNKAGTARHADIIFVLINGKIIEQGTHEELHARRGEYYRMLQQENIADEEESVQEDVSKHRMRTGERNWEGRKRRGEQIEETSGLKMMKHKLNLDTETDIFKQIPSISKLFMITPEVRKFMYFGIFGCLLSGAVIPLLGVCLGQILAMFIGDKEDLFATGIFWVEMLIGVAIVAAVGYCVRTIFIGLAGERLALSLRLNAYESILRQPISWFDFEANSPSFLYARLASDIPFIRKAVGERLGTAISALVTMVTVLVITFILSWKIAICTVFTIPVTLSGFYILQKNLKQSHIKLMGLRQKLIHCRICATATNRFDKTFNLTRDLRIRTLADYLEGLTSSIVKNIAGIHANCMSYTLCKKAEEYIYPSLVEGQRQAVVYAFVYAFSECLMFLTFGGSFRLGAEFLRSGDITILSLFTAFFVLTFGSLSLGQLTSFIPEYFKARISSGYVFNLIEMKSSADPYDVGGFKPPISGHIEFRDVVFSYPLAPENAILKGVNLIIPAGSLVGIVGPAGGGKSSILTLLERFYETESGDVLIDGVNIKDINFTYLRSNIGYLSPQPHLFDMTIKDNITAGYHGKLTGIDLQNHVVNAAKAASADFIMDDFPNQFATRCGEHGKYLSAAQRQEVALARTVINNPPILLLDDPTSCLGAEEEKDVQEAMHRITKNRTTIIVHNSFNSNVLKCEYVALLFRGKIKEFGKQEELLEKKGFYYRFLQRKGVIKVPEVPVE